MNYKKNKTEDFFERLASFLANKPLFITLTYFLICFGIGLLIFYFYIVVPQEKIFIFEGKVSRPNRELFFKINKLEKKNEDKEEVDQDEEIEKEITEIEEEEIDEKEISGEEMSEDELEDVLARTLFELYEFKEGNLPTIKERSVIWEDLGLGDSEAYEGTYSQNILLLEKLKE